MSLKLDTPTAVRTATEVADLARQAGTDWVRAVYLYGSYADGTAVAGSDLDVAVVLAARAPAGIGRDIRLAAAGLLSAVPVDLLVANEEDMARLGAPWLFDAAVLVAGTDIRPVIPNPPPPAAIPDLVHAAFRVVARGRLAAGPIALPVLARSPGDPWLGYVTAPAGREPGTQSMVKLAYWAADGLVGIRAGRWAGRKGPAAVAAYREYVGDGWDQFLVAVYDKCRGEWGYRVPAAPAGRAELGRLCGQLLAFENHFLSDYVEFLDAESGSPDPRRRRLAAAGRAETYG